VQSHVETEF